VEWISDAAAQGNGGAAILFVVTFPLPILDDASPILKATETGARTELDLGADVHVEGPATAP
jgi:hypothetical protein